MKPVLTATAVTATIMIVLGALTVFLFDRDARVGGYMTLTTLLVIAVVTAGIAANAAKGNQ